MRIKIRTLVGLGVVGAAVYAHRRHGGDMSMASMKRSMRDLWAGIQNKSHEVKARAEEFAEEAQDKARDVARRAKREAKAAVVEAQDMTRESEYTQEMPIRP